MEIASRQKAINGRYCHVTYLQFCRSDFLQKYEQEMHWISAQR